MGAQVSGEGEHDDGSDGQAPPREELRGVALEDLLTEEQREFQKGKKRTKLNIGLGLVAFGAGAYKGFCDGHGIRIEDHSIDLLVTYGPTALQSLVGAVKSVRYGLVGGGVLGWIFGVELSETTSGRLAAVGIGTTAGLTASTAIGVTAWGAKGALQSVCGYIPGYLVGWATR